MAEVFEITTQDKRDGEFGPYYLVTIKPGGKAMLAEEASVEFFTRHGLGLYAGTIEESKNGRFVNRKIKNLSAPTITQQAAAVAAQASQPAQNDAGVALRPGTDFRTPAQFMRATAVEQAVSMVNTIFSRMPALDMTLSEEAERTIPIQDDAIGVLNAQAMELYLNWYDIFETSISKGLGVSAEPVPATETQGPRTASSDVTSKFWQEAKEGWPNSKDFRVDANNWLVGLPDFGKPFADLTPDKRQEALTALLKEMGKAS